MPDTGHAATAATPRRRRLLTPRSGFAGAVLALCALMPVIAKESGAKVVEINPEKTLLTADISNYLIMGKAGEVMNRIIKEMEKIS